ncbi:MAG: isoprenylcysteine carboxylmethyltransferase family protein [Chloroflexi bacterium]|nr:isoprenylcysteine carboxylmethyltransferase family protein [Chloroflexota bacterium]
MNGIYRYIISAVICAVIWILNGRYIADGVRKHVVSETYAHTALGIFFTVLTLELTLGGAGFWTQGDILWVRIVGLALYAPSIVLVLGSSIQLHRKGEVKGSIALSINGTSVVVDSGVFRFVQHPMWLGMIIWAIALMLVFQSVLSMVLGAVAIGLFRMTAMKETEFNMEKFGDPYREYIERVPMLNVFKGLRK